MECDDESLFVFSFNPFLYNEVMCGGYQMFLSSWKRVRLCPAVKQGGFFFCFFFFLTDT